MTFNLDDAIRGWLRELRSSRALEAGDLAELEAHVRDEVNDLVREGHGPREAFRAVAGSLESLDILDAEYTKSREARGWTSGRVLGAVLPASTWTDLKSALRRIRRQKGYLLVNLAGLALGMACCVSILLYVRHEWSFDRFHANAGRIYRLVSEHKTPDGTRVDAATPPPLGPALAIDFPSVSAVVRFFSTDNPAPLVAYADARFAERRFLFADPEMFAVFTIPFLQGNAETALRQPYSVVVTASTARKYFGEANPLGKSLRFNDAFDLEVTGVAADPPSNSTLQFDFLASFATAADWLGRDFLDDWQNNMCQTYVLVADRSLVDDLAGLLPAFVRRHLGSPTTLAGLHLQPLNRIHLFSYRDYGLVSSGDIERLYLLFGVAVFILFIACINFINSTTARSALRFREVAIRKLIGARKSDVVRLFLWESLLTSAIALGLAVVLVKLYLPQVGALVGADLARYAGRNLQAWLAPIGLALLAGFLAGSGPALILSSVEPLRSLKGRPTPGIGRTQLRKSLVIVQFALTTVLIIGSGVVRGQLSFMERKALGFDKDRVIVVPIRDQGLRQDPEPLRRRLLERPGITGVGAAALLPGGPTGKARFRAEGIARTGTISVLWVDQDFIKTLGIKMAAGRDFSRERMTDASSAFILNEAAVAQLGWGGPEEAVGKAFELLDGRKGNVIGVTQDFNFVSLHRRIEPLALYVWPWLNYALIRVEAGTYSGVLSDIEALWHEFEPASPFTYFFLGDNFERLYHSEKQLGKASVMFGLIAVVIACLGLLGLTAFAAEQRTKEIGIRKVLGASVPGIVTMLARELLGLVFVANIVAWPIAFLALRRWLQDYAFRIEIGWGVFLSAGVLTFVIAGVTLSFQSIKAARANPVKSLRYQ
jgi:putative ABC transport system permease protein